MSVRSSIVSTAGASSTTYVDDVFSTTLYTGNGGINYVSNTTELYPVTALSAYYVNNSTISTNPLCSYVDSSNNVYMGGYCTNSAYPFLTKFNSTGTILWSYLLNAVNSGKVYDITENSGSIIVVGESLGLTNGGSVVSLDPSGTVNWTRSFIGSTACSLKSVKRDSSGNIYATGNANDANGNFLVIVKLTSTGTVTWANKFKVAASTGYDTDGASVDVDSSGNVYVSGYTQSTPEYYSFVMKLDSTGTIVWQKFYKGSTSVAAFCSAVRVDSSNNVYTAGRTNLGVNVIKFDSAGNTTWKVLINSGSTPSMELDSNGNSYVYTGDLHNDIVKLDTNGNLIYSTSIRNNQNNIFKDQNYNSTIKLYNGSIWFTGVGGITQTPGSRLAVAIKAPLGNNPLIGRFDTITNLYFGTTGANNIYGSATATTVTNGTFASYSTSLSSSNTTNPTLTSQSITASGLQTLTATSSTAAGGLLWIKSRSSESHALVDTVTGTNRYLVSNTSAAATDVSSSGILASNGFMIPSAASVPGTNTNAATYTAWTFKKQPKFLDVVTWTGDNTTRNISHSLGITPGMIIIKRIDVSSTQGWVVWHTSTGGTNNLLLSSSVGAAALTNGRISAATSTTFTVQAGSTNIADVNATGGTYVAYVFAHDTASDGLIQCGNFTADGTGAASVTLGWEPQFLLVKITSATTGSWFMYDNMRGMAVAESSNPYLLANTTGAEGSGVVIPTVTSTGFSISSASASQPYVYMAIRSSNKPPTSSTQIFFPQVATGTGSSGITGLPFSPDMMLTRTRSTSSNTNQQLTTRYSKARYLLTRSTSGESTTTTGVLGYDIQNGIRTGTDANELEANASGTTYSRFFFKRAAGVFDFFYSSLGQSTAGVYTTINHNLGVTPELVIAKQRSQNSSWFVHAPNALTTNKCLYLDGSSPSGTFANTGQWSPVPTSTAIFPGNQIASGTGVAVVYFLFATLPGISKVGAYTGNGTSQTINCGFSTGARFVLIKRTDTLGDWLYWDTARGIVAGNDPYAQLNFYNPEVTSDDSIDPDSTGFIVNQVAATNINVNTATYIYLAFA